MITRLSDWEKRLVTFLSGRVSVPFNRASNDCVRLAADAVLAITGTDIGSEWRTKYADDLEALRILASMDWDLLPEVSRVLEGQGLQEIPVLQAQRGDLGFHRGDRKDEQGVGIFAGKGLTTISHAGGLRSLPRSRVEKAWRIPYGNGN